MRPTSPIIILEQALPVMAGHNGMDDAALPEPKKGNIWPSSCLQVAQFDAPLDTQFMRPVTCWPVAAYSSFSQAIPIS